MTTFAYQWTRAGANITGATSNTYVSQAADVGHAIGCTVTATNTGGSTAANSNTITVTSAAVPLAAGTVGRFAPTLTGELEDVITGLLAKPKAGSVTR